MITTILFDMGGTLEDIWYDDATIADVIRRLRAFLKEHQICGDCEENVFWEKLSRGIRRYKDWSEANELELKPEQIWPDFYLSELNPDRTAAEKYAEEMAGMWEVTYYHRELRPEVRETLQILKEKGYRLGVISNTASLYSVFDVLEAYGIRDYFEDITLSSITGYRKPHRRIFEISLRQMQVRAEECAYVGDTVSRDIIGARRMHFGAAIQIRSFLSDQKDRDVCTEWKPDCIVGSIAEIPACLEKINR